MKIKLFWANEQKRYRIGFVLKKRIKNAIAATLRYEEFNNDVIVSVTFTDNEGIRKLNREFREKDAATDVLSFPMYSMQDGDVPDGEMAAELGDIVLSLEKAEEQSKEFGHSFERETAFLTVHSMLHLLGHDHELSEKDDEDMRKRQREIMEMIGLPR